MGHLFHTCHALVKHGHPFTDFLWHCELDKKKGLDVGNSYQNDKSAAVFTSYIANEEANKLKSQLGEAKFFSVLVDGSTDTSVKEVELSYVRYSICGEVYVRFLAIKSLERANAEIIFKQAILGTLQTCWDLDVEEVASKLVGFCSDGASVMTGIRTGVSARLKEIQPLTQTIHCMAHRLELSLKDSIKGKLEYVGNMVEHVKHVYLFYHQSALNRANLETACNDAGVKYQVPSKATGTRWVAHLQHALEVIISM
ncbi:putative sperm flagellar protein 2-like [Apostichopus japonicus]|uniref:Putative sperm flagellar protein 2-like n=1 Tax=Stichopus japonicus TaxID=307972 RepID=A0A2G8LK97_STIJA|nr:putative sperm flagellar protein 2-like [Apostichopus japonicus]